MEPCWEARWSSASLRAAVVRHLTCSSLDEDLPWSSENESHRSRQAGPKAIRISKHVAAEIGTQFFCDFICRKKQVLMACLFVHGCAGITYVGLWWWSSKAQLYEFGPGMTFAFLLQALFLGKPCSEVCLRMGVKRDKMAILVTTILNFWNLQLQVCIKNPARWPVEMAARAYP